MTEKIFDTGDDYADLIYDAALEELARDVIPADGSVRYVLQESGEWAISSEGDLAGAVRTALYDVEDIEPGYGEAIEREVNARCKALIYARDGISPEELQAEEDAFAFPLSSLYEDDWQYILESVVDEHAEALADEWKRELAHRGEWFY